MYICCCVYQLAHECLFFSFFFIDRPVGMPKMEKVYLHNPSSEEISLISISATTAHFHASFFQNRVSRRYHLNFFSTLNNLFLSQQVSGNIDCRVITNKLFIFSHMAVFILPCYFISIGPSRGIYEAKSVLQGIHCNHNRLRSSNVTLPFSQVPFAFTTVDIFSLETFLQASTTSK